jgi:UDP-N-acetylglucosamine acyltransferase
MTQVHATALVDSRAELHPSVVVGPYSVIGPHVKVGENTTIGAHCVIEGHTSIGRDNRIYQFNSIGANPQDKKYAGEPTQLQIGDRNTVREFCTLNTGTVGDGGITRLGDDNWIMAYVHIAHDCKIGSQTIMANHATLAGHVHLGDWVIVGGLTGIHQFVHVGAHAMLGFASAVTQDILPFLMVDGNPLKVRGVNLEGLKRRGFTTDQMAAIKGAYRTIFRKDLPLVEALVLVREAANADPAIAQHLLAMVAAAEASTRGVAR